MFFIFILKFEIKNVLFPDLCEYTIGMIVTIEFLMMWLLCSLDLLLSFFHQ